MKKFLFSTVIANILLLSACAITPELTQKEIAEQHPAITELGNQIEKAKANKVDLFAPKGYEAATMEYESANSLAKNRQNNATKTATETGLAAIKKANADAETNRKLFAEVIEARKKTIAAGADKMFSERLSELDNDFKEANTLVEEGSIEQAKRQRPELHRAYADLELVSLKLGVTQQARNTLAQAKSNNADKYSPKTYELAKEEIALAETILDTDRTDMEKAKAHANRATIFANRSNNITELVKDFDRRDFSNEDIVLWYQTELASASSPLNNNLTFDQTNEETVSNIRQQISELVATNNDLAKGDSQRQQNIAELNQKHAQEIAALESKFKTEIAALDNQYKAKLASQETASAEFAAFELAKENRFNRVQDMFSKNEAKVYRQKDDVLLSVYGFDFLPGSADINPSNFALMDKIVKSISEFENSKVVVSGHTDSTGKVDINNSLSQQRAQNVAKFLNEVGGIGADRITAEGYGQTQPVASNSTPEGRALNRRVEILIVNK